MGQFSSRGSVAVWDMVPAVRGVGFGQLIANGSVVSYYTCLIALAVYYLVASFTAELPWINCDPSIDIGNILCLDSGANKTQIIREMIYEGKISNVSSVETMSAAEQFFRYFITN